MLWIAGLWSHRLELQNEEILKLLQMNWARYLWMYQATTKEEQTSSVKSILNQSEAKCTSSPFISCSIWKLLSECDDDYRPDSGADQCISWFCIHLRGHFWSVYVSLTSLSAFHSFTSHPTSIPSSVWVIDSSASNHMTAIEQSLADAEPYTGHDQIIAANGHRLSISGIGSLDFTTPQHQSLHLSNVYFVPHLSANLISVGQLVDYGYSFYFSSSGCVIQERRTGKVMGDKE